MLFKNENSGDEGIFDRLFTSINLDANVIKKVVDEVNKISQDFWGGKGFNWTCVWYFLKSFAVKATKEKVSFTLHMK